MEPSKKYRILDEIVETNNLIIRNDKQPTYFEYRADKNYYEILDFFILSNDLNLNQSDFYVHNESILTNEINFHCPIEISINIKTDHSNIKNPSGYCYKAANWDNYKNFLLKSNKIENDSNLNAEQINDILTNEMIAASDHAIPLIRPSRFSKALPFEIICIINEKNKLKKKSKSKIKIIIIVFRKNN